MQTLQDLVVQNVLGLFYYTIYKCEETALSDDDKSDVRLYLLRFSSSSGYERIIKWILTSGFVISEIIQLLNLFFNKYVSELNLLDRGTSTWEEISCLFEGIDKDSVIGLQILKVGLDKNAVQNGNDVVIDERVSNTNIPYNIDPLLHRLRCMENLRELTLSGVCDNDILGILGKCCPFLRYLDISSSKRVTDVGIQNLIFPPSIQRVGKVNLSNKRVRTNSCARFLQYVKADRTNVETIGVVILLQFCPRLSGGGRISNEYVGIAVEALVQRLKVKSLAIQELWDVGETSIKRLEKYKEVLNAECLEILQLSEPCLLESMQNNFNRIKSLYLIGRSYFFFQLFKNYEFIETLHLSGDNCEPINFVEVISKLKNLKVFHGLVNVLPSEGVKPQIRLKNLHLRFSDANSFLHFFTLDLPELRETDFNISILQKDDENDEEKRILRIFLFDFRSNYRQFKRVNKVTFSELKIFRKQTPEFIIKWFLEAFPNCAEFCPPENWIVTNNPWKILENLKKENLLLRFRDKLYSSVLVKILDYDPKGKFYYDYRPPKAEQECEDEEDSDWSWSSDGQLKFP